MPSLPRKKSFIDYLRGPARVFSVLSHSLMGIINVLYATLLMGSLFFIVLAAFMAVANIMVVALLVYSSTIENERKRNRTVADDPIGFFDMVTHNKNTKIFAAIIFPAYVLSMVSGAIAAYTSLLLLGGLFAVNPLIFLVLGIVAATFSVFAAGTFNLLHICRVLLQFAQPDQSSTLSSSSSVDSRSDVELGGEEDKSHRPPYQGQTVKFEPKAVTSEPKKIATTVVPAASA